jgi:hypothetical protein
MEGANGEGVLIESHNSSINRKNFEVSKGITDRFFFGFGCNDSRVSIKDSVGLGFSEYCLMLYDNNGLERFKVRRDTVGSSFDQLNKECDEYWVKQNVNFINQMISLATNKINYDF